SARAGRFRDDGFFDRFLFTFPAELPDEGETWREVSEESLNVWRQTVEKLLGYEMAMGDDRPQPVLRHLTRCGRDAWEKFTGAHAKEKNSPDFPPVLFGPWSKLKAYGARLALIIHFLRLTCGEVKSENIDGESMNRAADLVSYFKTHARKVYAVV